MKSYGHTDKLVFKLCHDHWHKSVGLSQSQKFYSFEKSFETEILSFDI